MNCHSHYMRDINSKMHRYEGQYSYSIYSTGDTIAGQYCCGHPCSKVKNDNLSVVKNLLNHATIFSNTKDIQLALITNHTDQVLKPTVILPPAGKKYFKDEYFIEKNINF